MIVTTSGTMRSALTEGLRLVFLFRPRPKAFHISPRVLAFLLLINLIAGAALEFSFTDYTGAPRSAGFVSFAANWAVLALCLALLPFTLFRLDLRQTITAIASSMMWMALIIAAIRAVLVMLHTPDWSPIVGYALLVLMWLWALLVYWRAGVVLADHRRWLAGPALALLGVASQLVLPNAPIFTSEIFQDSEASATDYALAMWPRKARSGSSTPEPQPIDVEATYYRQRDLLEESLGKLRSATNAPPAVFAVAMAPYSSQDVFKREVAAVSDLAGSHLGAQDRVVTLINHRDTLVDTALANRTNLDLTLRRIGSLMRPDKDFLFLYVTTHGSANRLSVWFPGFPSRDLTPDMLADMLDAAGIKNRILVISACYSGSFIPRLQNEDTLILTAARADRTSFGCSNDREWTYFGDAYFNHAIREGHSIIDAFAVAKKLVEAWEKKESLEPSEPQISLGARIETKLRAFRETTAAISE